MGFEIERKFLVDANNQDLQSIMQNKPITITQGYLENSKDHPIVFVTTGEKSFLNIILENFDKKFQIEISTEDANSILTLFQSSKKSDWVFNDEFSVVRLRVADNQGFLTLKGKTNGISRPEFEYALSYPLVVELLNYCPKFITKNRYLIPIENNLKIELDYFPQLNLHLAEIELPSEKTTFQKPAWLLDEVSHDKQYFNNNLIKLVPQKTKEFKL
jgi:CYTH domain-containing protein